MIPWRCWLLVFVLGGCGGGMTVATGDDDDDTTDPLPAGDDDDDDDTPVPAGEIVLADYPDAMDFTWEAGASECPFVIGTLTVTNHHESVDALLQVVADRVDNQPAVMFRPQGSNNVVPEIMSPARPGVTVTIEALYGCLVTSSFDTEVHLSWELPGLEGPFDASIPVHGEITGP